MNGIATATESIANPCRPLRVVGGVDPMQREPRKKATGFVWQTERGARWNYRRLGRRVAFHRDDLFRNGAKGQGLLQVLADGTVRPIRSGLHLAPILVDTLPIRIERDGKTVGELPASVHLNAMLRAECFLAQFRPVDRVSRYPMYQEDLTLLLHGYHQNQDGRWILVVGSSPRTAEGHVVKKLERALGATSILLPSRPNFGRRNCQAGAFFMPRR